MLWSRKKIKEQTLKWVERTIGTHINLRTYQPLTVEKIELDTEEFAVLPYSTKQSVCVVGFDFDVDVFEQKGFIVYLLAQGFAVHSLSIKQQQMPNTDILSELSSFQTFNTAGLYMVDHAKEQEYSQTQVELQTQLPQITFVTHYKLVDYVIWLLANTDEDFNAQLVCVDAYLTQSIKPTAWNHLTSEITVSENTLDIPLLHVVSTIQAASFLPAITQQLTNWQGFDVGLEVVEVPDGKQLLHDVSCMYPAWHIIQDWISRRIREPAEQS